MQGINKAKHVHLVDALLQMETLLSRNLAKESGKQLAGQLRLDLEVILNCYNNQVNLLAELISDYHELFGKAKMQFLPPKVKELKKLAEQDTRTLPILVKKIQLVYGT